MNGTVVRASLSARLEILECVPEGGGTRPPVLFVHGAFGGAWMWAEHFMPHFAAHGIPAYAVSLRGHGDSEGADALDWHSIADYVDDLDEAIDAIGAEVVPIGHSMGGMVVLKYLERGRLPAAVLLASVPPHGLLHASMSLAATQPDLFTELNSLLGTGRASLDAMQRALFAGPLPADRLQRYYTRFQRESQRAIWDMTLFDLPQAWRLSKPPMLVMAAERDALFPLAQTRMGFTAIGCEVETLAGTGHAVMLDRGWQRAADRVIEWLGLDGTGLRTGP